MKNDDINIGSVYDIKIGKNITVVRIIKTVADGGWEAISLSTGNPLVIKSADRLLGLHRPKKSTTAQDVTTPINPVQRKLTPNTHKPAKNTPPLKRASILDAAVRVLTEANDPLNCKSIVKAMTEKDYWKPSQSGKTPANTLHAAISKEIRVKGTASRFEKVARGQFGLS